MAASYTQQLRELQQLLESQQGSNRSPTDIAAADAQVTQHRQATAALQKLHQTTQPHADAVQTSSVIISNAEACAAAAACMQALSQLLLSPPAELYCGANRSPCCQPAEGLELAGWP
jgi:hypothetical protein